MLPCGDSNGLVTSKYSLMAARTYDSCSAVQVCVLEPLAAE
jgi:hypothetical protein